MNDNVVNVYFPDAIPGPPAPPRKEVITGVHPAHTCVGINAAGECTVASGAVADDGKGIIGMLKAESVDGQAAEILTSGKVTDETWEFTVGAPVYCGVDGVPTQTRSGLAFLKIIGVAIAVSTIELGLSLPTLFLDGEPELNVSVGADGRLVATEPSAPSDGGSADRTVTMGADLPAFTCIYLDESGLGQAVNIYSEETMNAVIGMIIAPAVQGESAVIKSTGTITNPDWDFGPGPVFVGASGQLAADPTDLPNYRLVGAAINSHQVELNIGAPPIKPGTVADYNLVGQSPNGRLITVPKSAVLGGVLLNIDPSTSLSFRLADQAGFAFGSPLDLSAIYTDGNISAGLINGLVDALNSGKKVQVSISGGFEIDSGNPPCVVTLLINLDPASNRYGIAIAVRFDSAGEVYGEFSSKFTIFKVGSDFLSSDAQSSVSTRGTDGAGSLIPINAVINYNGRGDSPTPPTFDGHLYLTVNRPGLGDPAEDVYFNLRQLTITALG